MRMYALVCVRVCGWACVSVWYTCTENEAEDPSFSLFHLYKAQWVVS